MKKTAKTTGAILLFALFLLLTGCDNQSRLTYNIVLPSGKVIREIENEVAGLTEKGTLWRDASDNFKVIAGTDYRLDSFSDQDGQSGILLCDSSKKELYRYATSKTSSSPQFRGEAGKDGSIWFCAENWNTLHMRGYVDGTLQSTSIFQVNPKDGKILFQEKVGKDELYLTARGDRIYFYQRGKEQYLFKWRLYSKPAHIYYREKQNWNIQNVIYTLDYTYNPNESTDRLYFQLSDRLSIYGESGYNYRNGTNDITVTYGPVEIPLTG